MSEPLAKQPPENLEAVMYDDVDLLRLRCCKFKPKLLGDQEAARMELISSGWRVALIDAELTEAMEYAREVRRAWLSKRRAARARRKAEAEEDARWLAAYPADMRAA